MRLSRVFFFSSRRRHTRFDCDWSSDVCSSDLYGSLEDESPFKTVRRLVTYEDYALRLLQDIGVHSARSYGVVEITPEREYLLATEFFKDAAEIGEAPVDDEIIDQGLSLVRMLWDAGIAHRDIKPGNLMVRPGELLLIDVAFAQVRPSPWRQARSEERRVGKEW